MDAADPSGEGAGEQDAEQQAGHDDADGASALSVVHEVGREREDDVGDGGEEPDEDAGGDEPEKAGRKRDQQQRDGDGGVHPHHEGAAFHDVAHGDEGEQAGGVADLGGDGDEADVLGAGVEALAHLAEQRLVVVDGGDADGAGEAQEGQGARRGGCCSWAGSAELVCELIKVARPQCKRMSRANLWFWRWLEQILGV